MLSVTLVCEIKKKKKQQYDETFYKGKKSKLWLFTF